MVPNMQYSVPQAGGSTMGYQNVGMPQMTGEKKRKKYVRRSDVLLFVIFSFSGTWRDQVPLTQRQKLRLKVIEQLT